MGPDLMLPSMLIINIMGIVWGKEREGDLRPLKERMMVEREEEILKHERSRCHICGVGIAVIYQNSPQTGSLNDC